MDRDLRIEHLVKERLNTYVRFDENEMGCGFYPCRIFMRFT